MPLQLPTPFGSGLYFCNRQRALFGRGQVDLGDHLVVRDVRRAPHHEANRAFQPILKQALNAQFFRANSVRKSRGIEAIQHHFFDLAFRIHQERNWLAVRTM